MLVQLVNKSKYLSILMLLIAAPSCESSKKTETESIVGEWSAEWSTNPEAFQELDGKNLSMNGKLVFNQDGYVEISAFGFPGCVFSSDTILNKLDWHVENDTINLINKTDLFSLSYKINKLNDSLIELEMMQDIYLTLRR